MAVSSLKVIAFQSLAQYIPAVTFWVIEYRMFGYELLENKNQAPSSRIYINEKTNDAAFYFQYYFNNNIHSIQVQMNISNLKKN